MDDRDVVHMDMDDNDAPIERSFNERLDDAIKSAELRLMALQRIKEDIELNQYFSEAFAQVLYL